VAGSCEHGNELSGSAEGLPALSGTTQLSGGENIRDLTCVCAYTGNVHLYVCQLYGIIVCFGIRVNVLRKQKHSKYTEAVSDSSIDSVSTELVCAAVTLLTSNREVLGSAFS
jgi:hypothetical protein